MSAQSHKTVLLVTDQLCSVLNALSANQAQANAYTPYGHHPFENGLLSLLGFSGELRDPLTGHFHLGNGYRQFNPVLMRFNSPDSWSPFEDGGLNAYAYCEGDPVNRSDPTGHMFKNVRSFFRENIRVGAAKPPKAAPGKVASSNSNASKLAGALTQPSSSSKKPRAESHLTGLSGDVNGLGPYPTGTTQKPQTASTGQQAGIRDLSVSEITKSLSLNRRAKSLGNLSENVDERSVEFYRSKKPGPDDRFVITKYAANPSSTHARVYAAMTLELKAPPTPRMQRIIRKGA